MKKSNLIIIFTVCLIAFVSLVLYRVNIRNKQKEELSKIEPPKTSVSVVVPKNGSVVETVSTTGTIISKGDVVITPKVTGKIINITVDEGDKVRKGQLLAEIEHTELSAQLLQANAQLNAAMANLQMMENGPQREEITRAQALEKQAEATYSQLKVNLFNAEKDLKRFKSLAEQDAITNQQIESSKTQVESLKKQIDAAYQQVISAKAGLQLLQNGTRPEQINASKAQMEQVKATIEILKTQLANYKIQSPIDGIVIKKQSEYGNLAGVNSPIFTISKSSIPEIEMSVTENEIGKVSIGQNVILKSQAFPSEKINIKINYISPVVDSQTRLVKVKANVISKLPVKIGMIFDCDIVVNERRNSMILPAEAVLNLNGKKVVYTVVNNKVNEKEIKVGSESPEEIEVISGINYGENIITKGNAFVKPGDKIQVQKPVAVSGEI